MIKLYKTKSELKEGATLALHNRLYVSGWTLSGSLKYIKLYPEDYDYNVIALKFINNTPVAVALAEFDSMQAFCRKDQRRNGYATECVDAVRRAVKRNYSAGMGLRDGSLDFWSKCGIPAS